MLQQNGPEPQSPRPSRLFAIDRRCGEGWRPVTHVLAIDEAEADRTARASFGIDEQAELRVEAMDDGAKPNAGEASAPLDLDNGGQCTYCGGNLDGFNRCYDCHRLRGGKFRPAFKPSAQQLANTPECDEGNSGIVVIGRPQTAEVFMRVPIVEVPGEFEAIEEGDEGGEAGE